ncbi:MAG: M14 family zinc carboxypeptidase, partial [Myxococcota bacterium]
MTAWIIAAALLSAPPTPKAFLGYEVGTRPASPATVVAYMSALAEASPRVRMVKMGETHEGRDLVLLLIGSEAHLASAEQLSETFRRVSDPRKVSSDDEARRALKGLPAVAWMSYTIHGNETSGSDSAMEVAYRLATSDDPITRAIRDQVLVYLDPLQNPDGRQRAVSAHESTTTKVVDLDTVSLHSSEMWPYGRGNHYLFDLNRDWFSLVHPESRARVSRIAQALPQLQVDAHEMGPNETFLFTPSRHPFNPQRPSTLSRWEGRFSRDLARAFDANGWSYYTREWNEEFFPGYGSSWSAYLGTIGILYEQARTQGFTLKQRGGTILTYKEAVAHQTTSSIANLQTLAENRAAVLEDWLRARRSAARASSRTLFKAYVFRGDRHPERARRLAEVLTLQGIEVLRASKPVTLNGAHDIFGTVQKLTVPAGSYLVRLDQPNARLIRNLFDFHVPMGAKFLREQREYLELGKGSRLYETTAWSLPHAYGLDTYWTSSIPSGAWEATPASP